MPVAVRLIKLLKQNKTEVHLIITDAAKTVLKYDLPDYKKTIETIEKTADFLYAEDDFSASIASGSFETDGMIVVPCSMKSLSAIANGYADNLVSRSADVCIKHKRNLVIVPRETPLNSIHLENMLKLSRIQNVWIVPPVVGYYFDPKNLEDMEKYLVGKIIECFGMEHKLYKKWK
ncbi:MAG: UbiX family flavin prenyltransferase [Candidatus Aenigmarchaeota archaeon]|nr:UbiX family flavin prenyltransferase [Candidatus Aenigmarchaeota archaeon]